MRNIKFVSGQVMAVAASLLLVAACGGGDDPIAENLTGTTTTSSSSAETTTTTSTTTSSTLAGTVTINAAQFQNGRDFRCLREGTGGTFGAEGAATEGTCYGSGDDAQYWKVTQYGDKFTLTNNLSNKCLGIAGASTENEAAGAVVACDGSPNTLWTLAAVAGQADRFSLVNANSGKCLEAGPSLANFGTLTQYTCGTAGQANQTWARAVITP